MSKVPVQNLMVCQVESTVVTHYVVSTENGYIKNAPQNIDSWSSTRYCVDLNGLSLIEQIVQRVKKIQTSLPYNIDYLSISLPGTIDGTTTIDGSSRLGITDQVNVTDVCNKLGAPTTMIFHDAECLAIGEILTGKIKGGEIGIPSHENFAYILIDEGVGSSIFINGRPYRGAGVAGHIGRLVVEPSGAFDSNFSSRGTLEVFASRPWISKNVVSEFLAEAGKNGAQRESSSAFRSAVGAAAKSTDTSVLTLDYFAQGLEDRDPIMVDVLQDAAQYLSIAINAIITIVNPSLILLGGGMITELPEFAKMVISSARRNAWAGAWNETEIIVTGLGRESQAMGAAYLLATEIQGRHANQNRELPNYVL